MSFLATDLEFRVAVAVLVVAFVAHRAFYTRKVQGLDRAVVREADLGAASRVAKLLGVPALLATVAYVVVPALVSRAAMPLPETIRWLGLGVALAGFVLLEWSQRTLGPNWSDDPKLFEDQQLVTAGPYRWIRHPIYAAFLLILGAPLLLSANAIVGGGWIAMTSLDVAARMRAEEEMLLARFGEPYRAYVSQTGRLLPRMTRGGSGEPTL